MQNFFMGSQKITSMVSTSTERNKRSNTTNTIQNDDPDEQQFGRSTYSSFQGEQAEEYAYQPPKESSNHEEDEAMLTCCQKLRFFVKMSCKDIGRHKC